MQNCGSHEVRPEAIAGSAPDFAPLTSAYEVELKEAGLTDWAGVLALATDAASAVGGNRPRLIGLPMLLLDVPIRDEAELAFVRTLATAAAEVLATVPAADQLTLGRLRDQLCMQVENLDERSVSDEVAASSTSANALANLQRRLFKEEEGSVDAKPDDTVEVFSAPGEGRECVEITRRVLSLARQGIPFDRIAVLLRSRRDTDPTSRRPSTGRVFRLTMREARFGLIPPDAPSVRFSSARPRACQRDASRSTFRWDRFRMRRSMVGLQKRFLAANAGSPQTPSLLGSRPRRLESNSDPRRRQSIYSMELPSRKGSSERHVVGSVSSSRRR